MHTRIVAVLAVIALALAAAPAHAAVIDLNPDGTWLTQDQDMNAGDYFTDTYMATANELVTVTDIFVISDDFNIYVNGILAQTAFAPNWTADGLASAETIDIGDPAAALASGLYANVSFFVNAGDVISIQDYSIPPEDSGAPFPDGTVAISAIGSPEPASMLLLGAGLAGLGLLRRKRA